MSGAASDVQKALLHLLADSNEVTQELASKGLSILFDACDDATQVESPRAPCRDRPATFVAVS